MKIQLKAENIKLIIKFLDIAIKSKLFQIHIIYRKSSYYKRYPKDSELNINKSIKENLIY